MSRFRPACFAASKQERAQVPEESVSAGEPQIRVDVTEAIDAGQDHRAASTVTAPALDLPAYAFLEGGVIVESRERIARREPLQDGILLPQLLEEHPVSSPQLGALDRPLQAGAEVGQIERP